MAAAASAAAKATSSYMPAAEEPSRAALAPMAVPIEPKQVVMPPAAVAAADLGPSSADMDRQTSAMSGQPTPLAPTAPTLYQVPTGWTLGPGVGQLLQLAVATGQLQLPAGQHLAQQQQDSQRAQQDMEQALEHQLPVALLAKTPVHAGSAAAETAAAMEIDPGSAGSSGVKENSPSPAKNWWVKRGWGYGPPATRPLIATVPALLVFRLGNHAHKSL